MFIDFRVGPGGDVSFSFTSPPRFFVFSRGFFFVTLTRDPKPPATQASPLWSANAFEPPLIAIGTRPRVRNGHGGRTLDGRGCGSPLGSLFFRGGCRGRHGRLMDGRHRDGRHRGGRHRGGRHRGGRHGGGRHGDGRHRGGRHGGRGGDLGGNLGRGDLEPRFRVLAPAHVPVYRVGVPARLARAAAALLPVFLAVAR